MEEYEKVRFEVNQGSEFILKPNDQELDNFLNSLNAVGESGPPFQPLQTQNKQKQVSGRISLSPIPIWFNEGKKITEQ